MRIVIQRVSQAKVEVEGEVKGSIGLGYCLFVCFENGDNQETIDKAIKKVINLRIFEDDNQKMNLNITQVAQTAILSISQFTLSWKGEKGNRPSFENSMEPNLAKLNFGLFNKKLNDAGVKVQMGVFGANMQVHLVNDGPVTFVLDF